MRSRPCNNSAMQTPPDKPSDSPSDASLPEGADAAGSDPTKLKFPCDYPIKVMARTEGDPRPHIHAILEQHAGPIDHRQVSERPSSQGNFIAITYIITATGHEQLAALFVDLKRCPQVVLVL